MSHVPRRPLARSRPSRDVQGVVGAALGLSRCLSPYRPSLGPALTEGDAGPREGGLRKEKEMDTKLEEKKAMGKLGTYVRWIVVGIFGALILFTVIMAAYRKFGG